jgi:hypothetical protein
MPRCVGARFFDKVDLAPDGCWLWTGAIDETTGYARLGLGRKSIAGHVIAYRLLVGEVPKGLELDHLCRVRHCVNPRHLEPVTRRENLLRGDTLAAAHHKGVDCGFAACKSCARHRRIPMLATGTWQ